MLRSCIYIEGQMLRRNEFTKAFRILAQSSSSQPDLTVLKHDPSVSSGVTSSSSQCTPPKFSQPQTPPPQPPRSTKSFTLITALTFTASLGGVYLYRKMKQDKAQEVTQTDSDAKVPPAEESIPAHSSDLPSHVQYLVVGGGTAAFSAMRAIRSARPDAQVLMVSRERALPYMRPPLSKELWREPNLASTALHPDTLSFQQWNGRRRNLLYEPSAFYTPPEKLRETASGAGVARGWLVTAIDPEAHTALLENASGERATLGYDKCLIASGLRPKRLEATKAATEAGRSFTVRSLSDVSELAKRIDAPVDGAPTVCIVGGGLLGAELASVLADRVRELGGRVVQLFRENAPLASLLPPYLAGEAARTLESLGVTLMPHCDLTGSSIEDGKVRLTTAEGTSLRVDVVVECVGSEPQVELARRSRLETHDTLGGVVVNSELQARTDVWAAGDVACFFDEAFGRRRVEHHDHAVASGRLAGENMVALRNPKPYTHQSMFWSDLGPHLGYEAIGLIDSSLETVGVFCEDAVRDVKTEAAAAGASGAPSVAPASSETAHDNGKRYDRGVVFYLREKRVVGVLLWNLFNRMHVARQVLARGEFDNLLEVAKLFSLHEDE
ncbi:unnamed protein product [Leptosia nina]|uniref:Apoptosis-inducing factor 1, mitochondrial n=1 Tax=Leptosia nina TaxID=320188 RepID=A0AAV1IYW0_9NEOP